ncbi:MAG: ATP-binding protein [Armatimonadota bacterium]
MTPPFFHLRFAADMESLLEAIARLRDPVANGGLPGEVTDLATLALEDLATNAIKYGGASALPDALGIDVDRVDGEWRIVIENDGADFDPTVDAPPVSDLPFADHPLGGLGLRMIKRRADRFEHHRVADRNRRLIAKRFPEGPSRSEI